MKDNLNDAHLRHKNFWEAVLFPFQLVWKLSPATQIVDLAEKIYLYCQWMETGENGEEFDELGKAALYLLVNAVITTVLALLAINELLPFDIARISLAFLVASIINFFRT